MPDINTGTPLRWENAGLVKIGSGPYTPLWIEAGSLKFKRGIRKPIQLMDRGAVKSTVLAGDEQVSTIEFAVKPTKLGMTGGTDLLTVLRPADSAGLKTTYSVVVDIPDGDGSSTGTRVTFTNCYLAEDPEYQARAGENPDVLNIKLVSANNAPTIATF
jgi:hypothetical protein